jgi:hypothetical protein
VDHVTFYRWVHQFTPPLIDGSGRADTARCDPAEVVTVKASALTHVIDEPIRAASTTPSSTRATGASVITAS